MEKRVRHRQEAAHLLDQVLDEVITPRQAINRWPAPQGDDPSLDVAYQALFHFEADEDAQQTETFYLDAQLALLEQIRGALAQGRDLPEYVLKAYGTEHLTGWYDERWVLFKPFIMLKNAVTQGLGVIRDSFFWTKKDPRR